MTPIHLHDDQHIVCYVNWQNIQHKKMRETQENMMLRCCITIMMMIIIKHKQDENNFSLSASFHRNCSFIMEMSFTRRYCHNMLVSSTICSCKYLQENCLWFADVVVVAVYLSAGGNEWEMYTEKSHFCEWIWDCFGW